MIFKNPLYFVLLFLFSWNLEAQVLSQSNLPILRIKTFVGKSIKDEPKVPVEMELFDKGPGLLNSLTDVPAHKFVAGIEFRGSTSQGGPNFYFLPNIPVKMPYGFEIWTDTTGKFTKELSLANMGAESDWVLNASYNDRSFLRDFLAQRLGQKMGLLSSEVKFVELILDNQYQGVYLLMEKIKQGKNRVPIDKLRVTDTSGDALTGGYILKLDKNSGSAPNVSFSSNYVTPLSRNKPQFLIDYPKKDSLVSPQLNYIKSVMTDFEKSLFEDNPLEPSAKYRKMMDIPSFVNYFFINELSKNVDAYRLSTFFYKERDSKGGKIKMGPVWDYNLSFGNADYYNGNRTNGWMFNIGNEIPEIVKDGSQAPFWWSKLLGDTVYVNKLSSRWKELRRSVINTNYIYQQIDSVQTVLKEPLARNFQRYPLFGKYIWPNGFVGANMDQEIAYLKDWFPKRIAWIESKIQMLSPLILANGEEPFLYDVNVFPNPGQEKLQVRYQMKLASKASVFIFDLSGQIRMEQTLGNFSPGEHTSTLDISQLSLGTYVLVLSLGDVISKQVKFVKN
jgi:hypothetical protein